MIAVADDNVIYDGSDRIIEDSHSGHVAEVSKRM